MRKFIFLVSFLLLPLACISISGWMMESPAIKDTDGETGIGIGNSGDSLAKNYFPLKIGNSWTYKSINSLGDTAFVKVTVQSDTVINNTTFYRLSSQLPFFQDTLITLDSVTGNLYSYSRNNNCASYRIGNLLDSLGSKLGDKVASCTSDIFYGKCMDTNNVNIFGALRNSKFFLSPHVVSSGIFNRFTENIGITYAFKVEGIRLSESRLLGCVLNNVVYGDTSTTTHIFGTVTYGDNNQPASNGYVKALQLNRSNGDIIVLDSVQIQPGGYYYFRVLPNDIYYIVAYPNSETECDYIPTYFPSTINWQNAVKVNTGNNPENVKISVYRKSTNSGAFAITGSVSSQLNQIAMGIKEANVYIKQGEVYKTVNITKNMGQYKLSNLPSGSFQIIVNRLGYVHIQQNIVLNNSNLSNINFYLQPTFIKTVNTIGYMPKKYKLNQNYPNPFNPATNIQFDIPKSTFVKLKIYNVTGKEAATLVSEIKSAGSYEVTFDARNLSSGIYFYRLETEEFNDTKRMMVVK